MFAHIHRQSLLPLIAVVLVWGAAACSSPSVERKTKSDVPSAPSGPTLIRDVVVRELDHPWGLAFLPNGDLLFTERSGSINVYSAATGGARRLNAALDDFVDEPFQAGMLGIAVDPVFAENRYVYTYLLSRAGSRTTRSRQITATTTADSVTLTASRAQFDASDVRRAVVGPGIRLGTFVRAVIDRSSVTLSKPATASAKDITLRLEPRDNRVVRWTLSPDAATLERNADIVTGIPYGSEDLIGHNGGRIRFGADGFLWITTGDGDFATNPQDGASLAGKILHVDRDGRPAPGNPRRPGFDPRVFTFGHRNPQGLAFHPVTGETYVVEQGPDRDDEVNRLEAGANYGWQPEPAPYTHHVPMTDTTRFPDARPAVWRSDFPTVAPSGATFLSGPQWQGWNGALVIATLAPSPRGCRLLALFFDDSRRVYAATSLLGEHEARLRAVMQAPDGTLYVAVDRPRPGGEIWRLRPS